MWGKHIKTPWRFHGIPWSLHGIPRSLQWVFVCFSLRGVNSTEYFAGNSTDSPWKISRFPWIPWGIKPWPPFCRIGRNSSRVAVTLTKVREVRNYRRSGLCDGDANGEQACMICPTGKPVGAKRPAENCDTWPVSTAPLWTPNNYAAINQVRQEYQPPNYPRVVNGQVWRFGVNV